MTAQCLLAMFGRHYRDPEEEDQAWAGALFLSEYVHTHLAFMRAQSGQKPLIDRTGEEDSDLTETDDVEETPLAMTDEEIKALAHEAIEKERSH